MVATRQSWDPESIFAEGFLVAVFVVGWRSLADRLGQEACVLSGWAWAWALGPVGMGRGGRGALPLPASPLTPSALLLWPH